MDINKCAKICGQETSAQINGSKWISDPPWCPAFNQRGGVQKRYFFQRAPVHAWRWFIGSQVPSFTCSLIARHSWTSFSTKSTCPTYSWGRVPSHNSCQTLLSVPNPFTHEQPPLATFTSNHQPPRQSSVCFSHRHLPFHPKWPVVHLLQDNIPIILLTCLPRPTDPNF